MNHSMRRLLFVLAVLVPQAGFAAEPAAPDTTEPVLGPIVTRHQAVCGGETVRYSATFAERVLQDTTGRRMATMSSTSYVRDGVARPAQRPVLFVFNGGPGASSTPLHFGALGPRRRLEHPDSTGVRRMVDNPECPLDQLDMVFIDPVGTGFGRVLPGGDGHPYWGVDGDARAVLGLIRDWLRERHRETSPVYICGESYGGFRLATLLEHALDLPIAGIVLISPMLDASLAEQAPGNDAPNIFLLPSMAAAAWYHGRVDRAGLSAEQWYERATAFAQGEYAAALYQGSRLPAAERERVAARVAALLGLPHKTVLDQDLRVDSEGFLTALLADKGLRIGRLDARATGNAAELAKRRPPMNDPSMTLTTGTGNPVMQYFREDLGVITRRTYVSLALDINGMWNWRDVQGNNAYFYTNPTPNIGAWMAKQPTGRVMLVGGFFDLATPYLAARYALDHAAVPPDRVTLSAFPAGHSVYDDENRARFVTELRRFVATAR